jgi:rod shape-determining protein MreD
MSATTWLRASVVLFVAAMLQVVIVSSLVIGGGAPDLLLVVVVVLGLLRGSIPGAILGFAGGLIVDVVTLGTLGVSSLVLTLAGFWAGRYAETTGRDRRFASLMAVGTITVLAAAFGFVLYYLLAVDVVAEHALVTALAPAFVLNLLLALPVHALVKRIVGEGDRIEIAPEMEVLAG